MATTYPSPAIQNNKQPRLVSVGYSPVYQEITPPTMVINDVYEMVFVPDGVRIMDGFLKAVGGTGLDTAGPTLQLKVDLVDDNGTTNLLAATTGVRATGDEVDFTKKGILTVSAKNNAKIKVTATAASNTPGTSKIAIFVAWSSFADV